MFIFCRLNLKLLWKLYLFHLFDVAEFGERQTKQIYIFWILDITFFSNTSSFSEQSSPLLDAEKKVFAVFYYVTIVAIGHGFMNKVWSMTAFYALQGVSFNKNYAYYSIFISSWPWVEAGFAYYVMSTTSVSIFHMADVIRGREAEKNCPAVLTSCLTII